MPENQQSEERHISSQLMGDMLSQELNKPIGRKLTGVELIAQERKEQIEKHGYTINNDTWHNDDNQLKQAARSLLCKDESDEDGLNDAFRAIIPKGWDIKIWNKMFDKSYKERLIIAGALIAAELDRINAAN